MSSACGGAWRRGGSGRSNFGRSPRDAEAGRFKGGRLPVADLFHAGLPAECAPNERLGSASFFQSGRAPGRPVGPETRSSFFQAGRGRERSEVRLNGRSDGRPEPNLAGPVPCAGPRNEPRLAGPRDGPRSAGRKSLPRGRVERSGLSFPKAGLGRISGRLPAGVRPSGEVAVRGGRLGRGGNVGNCASKTLRRRSSLALGVRSLPSAARRSATNSSASSSRSWPGSISRTSGP